MEINTGICANTSIRSAKSDLKHNGVHAEINVGKHGSGSRITYTPSQS